MKELLRKMFTGWKIHEASWDGERYTRDATDCMIEACGGDKMEGYLIYLFDHWANDIQAISGNWGIELRRDNENKIIITEVDPELWRAEEKARQKAFDEEFGHTGKLEDDDAPKLDNKWFDTATRHNG